MDIMQLGGNIKLIGFGPVESAKLIVAKKMIGNYARKISDKVGNFSDLIVELEGSSVKCKLLVDSRAYESKINDQNLFFAIDKALAEIMEKCS